MQLTALLQKDLRLSWRSRGEAAAFLAFGSAALVALAFAAGPDAQALRRSAAGFLWVASLFAGLLALSASFRQENEAGALEGLLLLPASPRAIFFAKALGNAAQLLFLTLGLLPVAAVLCDVPLSSFPALALVAALAVLGIAIPGTLHAAMTSRLQRGEVILPLLLLPLAVPVLLAATRATSLIFLGDPMRQLPSWIALLGLFDVLFTALCGALFGAVAEEWS